MATFYLVLIWAALGLFAGALALAAGLKPAGWRNRGRWRLLAVGLVGALLGGLLGFWLTGRLFSPAAALWLAILAVWIPGWYANARRRLVR